MYRKRKIESPNQPEASAQVSVVFFFKDILKEPPGREAGGIACLITVLRKKPFHICNYIMFTGFAE